MTCSQSRGGGDRGSWTSAKQLEGGNNIDVYRKEQQLGSSPAFVQREDKCDEDTRITIMRPADRRGERK